MALAVEAAVSVADRCLPLLAHAAAVVAVAGVAVAFRS